MLHDGNREGLLMREFENRLITLLLLDEDDTARRGPLGSLYTSKGSVSLPRQTVSVGYATMNAKEHDEILLAFSAHGHAQLMTASLGCFLWRTNEFSQSAGQIGRKMGTSSSQFAHEDHLR